VALASAGPYANHLLVSDIAIFVLKRDVQLQLTANHLHLGPDR